MPSSDRLDRHFPRYEKFQPRTAIWCVTPRRGGAFHRFFDTSPISPSGRYLAYLKIDQEQRPPLPGEQAEVRVVDLDSGEDHLVATTQGWENQMGANINWGPDDSQLIFNDVDTSTWQAFAVRCEVQTGRKHRLQGPVYHVSPDGLWACGANPIPMRRTQPGYGVVVPDEHVPRYQGPREDDGLWLTHTQTGRSELILSLADAIEKARPAFEIDNPDRYEIYGFHSKFNPQGGQLIFTIRFFENTGQAQCDKIGKGLLFTVLTLRPDGSDVRNAVPTSRWKKRGNHINWFPNGKQLSMNLVLDDKMLFVQCNDDGSNLRPILPDRPGTGHPTVHPDGKHILTDTYLWESPWDDGTTPLRWVDIEADSETTIARVATRMQGAPQAGPLRVDPHPAWDPTHRWVAFNACPDGTRRIYVMDMQSLIG